MRFGEEEPLEDARAESKDVTEITEGQEQHEEALSRDVMSTDEQNVMSCPEEAKTGRGRAGLVPGLGESRELNETSRKGKGKGNGVKGEHEGKEGGFGRKGFPAEREGKGVEWRFTWVQVAHTPRPRRIPERKKRRRKRHEC